MANTAITKASTITRFQKYVGPQQACGCRFWIGGTRGDYGFFRVSTDERDNAHRVAYRIYKGTIPNGKLVRHSCDMPLCVEEQHLLIGTYKDNTQDMIKRGRSKLSSNLPFGQKHPSAKLTEDEVEEIRHDTRSQRTIAKDFGISQPQVSYIKRYMSRVLA
jgi:hypothetical protein